MSEKKSPRHEINKDTTEEDIVRLPSVLKIRPGVYLAFLYGLAILLILFFITLYPGLTNPGTVLTVKTEPAGAAIRVDGLYMKAAPCEIFIPAGKHNIEAVMPGFTDSISEVENLIRFLDKYPVSMIQTRNMNIDPDYYFEKIGFQDEDSIGIRNLIKLLEERYKNIRLGYYNPPLKK